ncbi:MAG: ATP-grasp domain-containing protein [Acidobacteriota bacterium]|jgi:biotin carboxylase
MARALLLMPTTTYHAADFVDAAAALGVSVTVGTNGSQALQEQTPGSTLTLDFNDLEGSVAAIEALHRNYPLSAVVAADDETTALAAAAAGALGLPHNPLEAVLPTRSKLSLRGTLADHGFASPAFRVLNIGAGFADQPRPERDARLKAAIATMLESERVPFPCVLKPTFLAASRGVIRADDEVEFRAAARRIGEILHDERRAGGGNPESHLILVEEYIPGDEYAVEAMLRGGDLHLLALFDKPDPLEGPYFEETIYVTPSRAPETVQEQIVGTVAQAVAAFGLREGPLHAELRVNESGVYIVDLAARAIGGLCPRVLRFGTGMSLEELILRHALGEDFTAFRREDGAGGVMMIPIPRAGTLRGVKGVSGAREIDGIREVTFTINPGQRVLPLPEGNRYLGFIFAHADTPTEAEAALRAAYAQLTIDVEPA